MRITGRGIYRPSWALQAFGETLKVWPHQEPEMQIIGEEMMINGFTGETYTAPEETTIHLIF